MDIRLTLNLLADLNIILVTSSDSPLISVVSILSLNIFFLFKILMSPFRLALTIYVLIFLFSPIVIVPHISVIIAAGWYLSLRSDNNSKIN